MQGYVANTDIDWFRFLRERQPEEVNFWQPGGGRPIRTVEQHAPFLFRLKRPHYKIAGFGFLAHFTQVPAWMAWNLFGEANGASDAESMYRRIVKYRAGAQRVADVRTAEIGCLLVTAPVFFPDDQWVKEPRDFSRRIVSGKTYDLSEGEGARIWRECLDRAAALDAERVPGFGDQPLEGPRYRLETVRQRLGQGTFRMMVVDAYERRCAVTEEHSLPVLEAAHIQSFAEGGPHLVRNGLTLRADLHRLFDSGYITVSEDYRLEVSGRLHEEWENGRVYYAMHGQKLHLPRQRPDWPDPRYLEWHRERFLG